MNQRMKMLTMNAALAAGSLVLIVLETAPRVRW